jgi:FkbM family methyltransferase
MSVLRLIRRVASSPINRDHKVAALWRFAKWQVGSRLVPGKVLVDWIDGAKFIAGRGEHGLTGNIYNGLHEFHDMAYVLHALNDADLFIDVGANVGSYTVLACGVVGAEGYCFEPVPSTYRRLVMNLSVNNLLSRVQHFNQGVGDRSGVLRFTSEQDSTNHVLADGEADAHAVEVPVVPLDECLQQSPSMMKIDVEGYETMVLKGAARVLGDARLNSLLIELNGSGAHYGFNEDEIVPLLAEYGFQPYQYDGFQRQLTPLEGRNTGSGNTLFIRDVEFARRRTAAARQYQVLGKKV